MTTRTAPRRRLVGVLLGLAIAAAPVLGASSASASAPAAAARQVTFGVQPASATRPDQRPNLSYGVTPGVAVRDHVAIVNFSAAPLTLTVYATDAVNTSDGGFGLLTGGQKPTGAGAWTSVGGRPAGLPVTVRVPARRSTGPGYVILPVLMRVPAGANPGDHVGGVVAVLSTIGTNKQGAKVRLDQRVATRLFVRVSGVSNPRLVLEGLTSTYHPGAGTLGTGTVTVAYTVHNTGNVSLGARQSVQVAGLFGLGGADATVADVPLLLPGASVRQSVDVAGVLPLVRMTATVTLRPIPPAGAVDPGLPGRIVDSTSFWALPWALLLLVLAGVGVALWWRHRNRSVAGPGGSSAPPTPAVREPQGVSS